MSGSVSRSKNDPSQSLQMIERPLMTPDELKSMPKGQFVVMKTGFHPMKVRLKLFFKWGIEFDKDNPYTVEDNGGRAVVYAEKKEIIDGIVQKYHPEWLIKEEPPADSESAGGENQAESYVQNPQRTPLNKPKNKGGGTVVESVPLSRRMAQNKPQPQEVKSDGQA